MPLPGSSLLVKLTALRVLGVLAVRSPRWCYCISRVRAASAGPLAAIATEPARLYPLGSCRRPTQVLGTLVSPASLGKQEVYPCSRCCALHLTRRSRELRARTETASGVTFMLDWCSVSCALPRRCTAPLRIFTCRSRVCLLRRRCCVAADDAALSCVGLTCLLCLRVVEAAASLVVMAQAILQLLPVSAPADSSTTTAATAAAANPETDAN